LKARVYIDLVGLEEVQARVRLLTGLRKKEEGRKPAREPDFPTTSVTSSEPVFPGPSPQQRTSPCPRSESDPILPSTSVPTTSSPHENGNNETRTTVLRRAGFVGGIVMLFAIFTLAVAK